jgi:HAE1 family hydrophobic/amphiphilic exporter-1
MLPLAIGDAQVGGGSNGGPAYYPMARAIIGGLGFSTIVSLLIVPSMYVWLDNAARWTRKVGTRNGNIPLFVRSAHKMSDS